MQNYAINNNLTPFISMQNHHSLIYREEEREMSPTLKVRVSLVPSTIQLIMTLCKALWRVCDSVVVPRARPSVQALQEPDSYEARRDGLVPQELGGQHDTERHRRPRGRDCKEEGRQHGTSCHRLGGFQRWYDEGPSVVWDPDFISR